MLNFGRNQLIFIALMLVMGVLYSVPNFFAEDERYAVDDVTGEVSAIGIWGTIPSRSINLGLDLQGGAHLVFEADMDQVQEDLLDNLHADTRQALRQAPIIPSQNPIIDGDEVVVIVARAEDRAEAFQRLQGLSEPVNQQQGQISLEETLNVAVDPDDDRMIRMSITQAQSDYIQGRTIAQSIEVVRNRLDGLGTVDPTIARQGENRILVQVPGAEDPGVIVDIVSAVATMSFHAVDTTIDAGPNGEARMPPGREVARRSVDNGGGFIVVHSRALLTGEHLTSASVGQDARYNGPVVNFRFNTEGALIFGEHTRNNRGNRFAIILDDEVISDPNINDAILTGSGLIGGNFNFESANLLAIKMNAGALPAALTVVEERTVAPSTGADNIEKGKLAIMIGFGLVIVFMLAAYGVFGVFSTIALLANVVLIVGALSGLGATLTLSGIAGIILTIGMAVDANVLIYERIREESRNGRTPAQCIEVGYQRAREAILDANITTLIAAAVLLLMGAGPVRGFAITLGIGIVTSVFTAFVFSRLLAVIWLRATKPKALPL